MAKRLVILGAPGAGKGTQAANICEYLEIPTFSTGQMLREQIASGSELGKQAAVFIEQGSLVPSEVVYPMVRETLASEGMSQGFLADGFPRSIEQAEYLDQVLSDLGTPLDLVINIDVDLEGVVERLLKRAEIEHRADDTEPVIRHRLEVYKQATEPLISFYEAAGILRNVDGNGTIDEVWQRIREILQ